MASFATMALVPLFGGYHVRHIWGGGRMWGGNHVRHKVSSVGPRISLGFHVRHILFQSASDTVDFQGLLAKKATVILQFCPSCPGWGSKFVNLGFSDRFPAFCLASFLARVSRKGGVEKSDFLTPRENLRSGILRAKNSRGVMESAF